MTSCWWLPRMPSSGATFSAGKQSGHRGVLVDRCSALPATERNRHYTLPGTGVSAVHEAASLACGSGFQNTSSDAVRPCNASGWHRFMALSHA